METVKIRPKSLQSISSFSLHDDDRTTDVYFLEVFRKQTIDCEMTYDKSKQNVYDLIKDKTERSHQRWNFISFFLKFTAWKTLISIK